MTIHVEAKIDRYFAGRVADPREREHLFGHLQRCTSCRVRFEDLAAVHRTLAGEAPFPSTELALIAPALIEEIVSNETASGRWRTWFARALVPVAATIAIVVSVGPSEELTSKGGASRRVAVIEALCFDGRMEVVAHLAQDGACPAPGYVKLLYASPETVPSLSVLVLSNGEVRLSARVSSPVPRSVLPDYVALAPGEVLEVRAIANEPAGDDSSTRAAPPLLRVRGESP